MKLLDALQTPFPRPRSTRKYILWVFLVGLSASFFILLFEPFGIENTTGEWLVDLVIFSLGILFILSILFAEFLIPLIFPKPFLKWTLGKALIWYPLVVVFVGGSQFLYKSWWGGWNDFTWQEFLFVQGRMLGIGIVVIFFVLGIWHYLDRRRIALISSKENYIVETSDGKSLQLNLKEVLYLASDDNYVDIHMESEGVRKKIILRSSLKNIETQISNSLSPIMRCHRQYLVNTEYFHILKAGSRKMTIGLENYDDQIPVSGQFVALMKRHLIVRP